MFGKDKSSFSEKEAKMLEFWEKNAIFQKSLQNTEDKERFSFYDGPPFATGLPHYGHILASTIKDVVARYKTMKGYHVPRRFGWDCHGLPIENEIEKLHNLRTIEDIEKFGIARFNEECRNIVLRYTKEWKSIITRVGRWVEFDRTWRTMDLSFMETVWWIFGELWDKDLIYEGFKVMHYSPTLGTPLSNFEANLNYQEVDDPSLTVQIPLEEEKAFLLVWTTTPWTLPSNLALGVNAKITYVRVRDKKTDQQYILAKDLVAKYFQTDEIEITKTYTGSDLVGRKYHPLFSYFADSKNAFQILSADFVKTTDGTGVVHLAPAFGEDDFFVAKDASIVPIAPIDENCRFTEEVPDFQGIFVKDADKSIMRFLKKENRVFRQETIRHRYPFCWRTDAPLIYRTVSTWFVAVEKVKEKLLENNQKISWVPEHIKTGRFGMWLNNARDWAISRSRFWGTPMPIWRSEDGECIVIRSQKELAEEVNRPVDDLHRHFIDDIVIERDEKKFYRIPEVFDCWFESGSMPYGQNHFPFENKEETLRDFPADFIAEGLDQTRGWFYTLHVLATALFNKPAFKNVIVNGIVLAEDGQKMSKRLKNYPDPILVCQEYGADAMRLYLLHSPIVRAEDLNFQEEGVKGILKQILIPMYNSYVFLATYAEIYQWSAETSSKKPQAEIDRWILSKMHTLIDQVENGMNSYHLDKAVEPFVSFIESLTNWYIRRSRQRFWNDEDSLDRREAFSTLYTVLLNLVKISAPYVPFMSEYLYQELRQDSMPESVHLCSFPNKNDFEQDMLLEDAMQATQLAVTLGHSLRKEHQIKVRQPLSCAHVVSRETEILEALKSHETLIQEELNVKKVMFHLDESQFVKYSPKPNFRVLGKKVGKSMKEVQKHIHALEEEKVQALLQKQPIDIPLEDDVISLTEEDIILERQIHEGVVATSTNSITVALDLELTEDLEKEGIAREIVNKINTLRKRLDFSVTDRIAVCMETTQKVKDSVSLYESYICQEILAKSFSFDCVENPAESLEINGQPTKIFIKRV